VPWLLALPGVAFLLAFHLVASSAGGWYAFTSWDGLSASARFVGLQNFRELFADDPIARHALLHTLQLAGCFVVLANVIGLGLALALNRAVKSRHFLRALFFAPVVASPLAVAYIWTYIFDYKGPLNQLLEAVGAGSWQRPWLGDPTWAIWTVLVVLVWQFAGLTMVIYLAGLQGVPIELEEAASVDGATTWFRFRRITFPLLAPAMTVNVTLTTIFGLRVFDQVLALTNGGPVNATETLATQMFKQTWVNSRFGYGASIALVLSAMIAVFAVAQAVVLRRREARI
jgi:raffinose/stachyose/melibiose transport system permease protein